MKLKIIKSIIFISVYCTSFITLIFSSSLDFVPFPFPNMLLMIKHILFHSAASLFLPNTLSNLPLLWFLRRFHQVIISL